jgi:ATP-dependent Clp protease protease subunit
VVAQGKRAVLPNTKIMIHQPSGAARGQAADIYNEAKELLRLRTYLSTVLAKVIPSYLTIKKQLNKLLQ